MKMARKAAKAATPAPMKAMQTMKAMKMAKKAAPKPMKAMQTMKAMKMAKKATPKPMKAMQTMQAMKTAVLKPKAVKAGRGKRADNVSTWIHVNTEGTKACLVEAWTTTNDEVYYKVYRMN